MEAPGSEQRTLELRWGISWRPLCSISVALGIPHSSLSEASKASGLDARLCARCAKLTHLLVGELLLALRVPMGKVWGRTKRGCREVR